MDGGPFASREKTGLMAPPMFHSSFSGFLSQYSKNILYFPDVNPY
jgi:hypothetical protein